MYDIGNIPEIEGLEKNKKDLMNYFCLQQLILNFNM